MILSTSMKHRATTTTEQTQCTRFHSHSATASCPLHAATSDKLIRHNKYQHETNIQSATDTLSLSSDNGNMHNWHQLKWSSGIKHDKLMPEPNLSVAITSLHCSIHAWTKQWHLIYTVSGKKILQYSRHNCDKFRQCHNFWHEPSRQLSSEY